MVVGNAYQFILDYHYINQSLNIVMSMKLICVIQVSCVFLICVLTYVYNRYGTTQFKLNENLLMKLCMHFTNRQDNIRYLLACVLEADDVSIACGQYKQSLRT